VVFDVGANIGNHTLAFARHAEQVYAFEPLPEIFAVLSTNVEQNGLANVLPLNMALSNENGQAEIYLFPENLGAASFDKHDENLEPIMVAKRIGEEIVTEQGIERVDFMKVDTEGHEAFVLEGLAGTIRRSRPFVMVEWHDPLTIRRFREADIFNRLFADYRIFVLGSNFDREYWAGRTWGGVRRRLAKVLAKKAVRLYDFDPAVSYKNILLVPEGKEGFLPG
jgi:FkbM family methyltransferase